MTKLFLAKDCATPKGAPLRPPVHLRTGACPSMVTRRGLRRQPCEARRNTCERLRTPGGETLPDVNPPVDAEHAERSPEFAATDGASYVRVGDLAEHATRPGRCASRYCIVLAGGRRFQGYLREVPPIP